MEFNMLAVRVAVFVLSAFWLSSGASAFCGMVEASATGSNQNQALSKANGIGLKETNDLDRKYGKKVKYQAAKSFCKLTNSGTVSCKITQRFCVNGGNVNGDEVDPNSPQCKKWQKKCKEGSQKSCTNYESNCQND